MAIIGAGPAGLSAALILGRCCRQVVICDRGTPRGWASKAMHGFLTRDGMPPGKFRDIALQELGEYPNVTYRAVEVSRVSPESTGFRVETRSGRMQARKVLIATGLEDQLPEIPRMQQLFGISVFQCPYCDGWEFRNRAVAVYGCRARGMEMARALTAWTRDILLCTDGPSRLTARQRRDLQSNAIRLIETRIRRLVVSEKRLEAVEFVDGLRVDCEALFFDTRSSGQSDLTEQLGCRFNHAGGIQCGKYEATSVPGVYVAGNIIRNVQLSIVAAAEGANAAFGIPRALTREDFERRATGRRTVEHTPPTPED